MCRLLFLSCNIVYTKTRMILKERWYFSSSIRCAWLTRYYMVFDYEYCLLAGQICLRVGVGVGVQILIVALDGIPPVTCALTRKGERSEGWKFLQKMVVRVDWAHFPLTVSTRKRNQSFPAKTDCPPEGFFGDLYSTKVHSP